MVDDGSTDDTAEVVRAAAARDARIKYKFQPNAGPSAARNLGMAVSSGEYIQFLDADDVLQPTKLAAQVRVLDEDPSIGIVYSDARYFRDSRTALLPHRIPGKRESTTVGMPGPDPVLRALVHNNTMAVEGPLMRRSAVTPVGQFEERLIRMEDWQYWLKCALGGVSFAVDNAEERAVLVRSHGNSSTRDLLAMHSSELAVRRWLEGRLHDPTLVRLNHVRSLETQARVGVLEGKGGRLMVGVRLLFTAGLSEHRLDWLLLACILPLLRLPGRDRALALRRRLMKKPGMW